MMDPRAIIHRQTNQPANHFNLLTDSIIMKVLFSRRHSVCSRFPRLEVVYNVLLLYYYELTPIGVLPQG